MSNWNDQSRTREAACSHLEQIACVTRESGIRLTKIIPDGRKAAEREMTKKGREFVDAGKLHGKIMAHISRAESGRAFEFPDDRFECWRKSDQRLVDHT